MDDLFAYLHEKVGISKSSLSWYLFKLVNENALVRTGRGMYAKVMKQPFVPKLIGEVREIYDSLLVNFPFAKFCVYQGGYYRTLAASPFFQPCCLCGNRQGIRQKRFSTF